MIFKIVKYYNKKIYEILKFSNLVIKMKTSFPFIFQKFISKNYCVCKLFLKTIFY